MMKKVIIAIVVVAVVALLAVGIALAVVLTRIPSKSSVV